MRRVTDQLGELLESLNCDPEFYERLLFALWRRALGNELAFRSKPVHYSEGVLKVATANEAWRNQLDQMREEIIRKMNSILRKPLLCRIDLIVDESLEQCALDKSVEHLEISQVDLIRSLGQEVSAIQDPELRKLFVSVVEKNLVLQDLG